MDKKDLATWFESLSKEEKGVVKLRFGIDGEEPLTLKEISLKLGIEISKAKLIEVKYILNKAVCRICKWIPIFLFSTKASYSSLPGSIDS